MLVRFLIKSLNVVRYPTYSNASIVPFPLVNPNIIYIGNNIKFGSITNTILNTFLICFFNNIITVKKKYNNGNIQIEIGLNAIDDMFVIINNIIFLKSSFRFIIWYNIYGINILVTIVFPCHILTKRVYPLNLAETPENKNITDNINNIRFAFFLSILFINT